MRAWVIFLTLLSVGSLEAAASSKKVSRIRQNLLSQSQRRVLAVTAPEGFERLALGCPSHGYFVFTPETLARHAGRTISPSYRCALALHGRREGKWRKLRDVPVSRAPSELALRTRGTHSGPRLYWAIVSLVDEDDMVHVPALINDRGEILYSSELTANGVGTSGGALYAYNDRSIWTIDSWDRIPVQPLSARERPDEGFLETQRKVFFGQNVVTLNRSCRRVVAPYPRKVFDYPERSRWWTFLLHPLSYTVDRLTVNDALVARTTDLIGFGFDERSVRHHGEIFYQSEPFWTAAGLLARREVVDGCNVAWSDIADVKELEAGGTLALFRDRERMLRLGPGGAPSWIDIDEARGEGFAGHLALLTRGDEVYLLTARETGYELQRGRIVGERWRRDAAFSLPLAEGSFPDAALSAANGDLLAVIGADLEDRLAIHEIGNRARSVLHVDNRGQPLRVYQTGLFNVRGVLGFEFEPGPL